MSEKEKKRLFCAGNMLGSHPDIKLGEANGSADDILRYVKNWLEDPESQGHIWIEEDWETET